MCLSVEGVCMRIRVRVPHGVYQRTLLCNQQQEDTNNMENYARHVCPQWPCHKRSISSDRSQRRLLAASEHRVGEPVIKPHRIVFEHREFAAEQYRLEAVFDR